MNRLACINIIFSALKYCDPDIQVRIAKINSWHVCADISNYRIMELFIDQRERFYF